MAPNRRTVTPARQRCDGHGASKLESKGLEPTGSATQAPPDSANSATPPPGVTGRIEEVETTADVRFSRSARLGKFAAARNPARWSVRAQQTPPMGNSTVPSTHPPKMLDGLTARSVESAAATNSAQQSRLLDVEGSKVVPHYRFRSLAATLWGVESSWKVPRLPQVFGSELVSRPMAFTPLADSNKPFLHKQVEHGLELSPDG